MFDGALYAMMHQMQQNLYFQFISHLKAIKKELSVEDKLLKISGQAETKVEETEFVEPKFDDVMQDPIQLQSLLSFAGRM